MAPPRQRPAGNTAVSAIDDSRSEASSGTVTGHQSRGALGPKPRKSGAAATASSTTGVTASSKDLKVTAVTGAVAVAAAAGVGPNGIEYGDGMRDDLPGIPWPQMPLCILHDYRHAYKLPTPSAYARPISKLYFSSGIGLRSPTAIASRKAISSSSSPSTTSSASSAASSSLAASRNQQRANANLNSNTNNMKNTTDKTLHKITSQDRVSKDQLALAVRKHFNAAGLVEQDAIARFLYKVREEGKGREFRLRFQP